jgi:DNA replication regulator DPB11
MGAEHKLDLTSDVTHLLVGDTETPKYKYVAREREDVRVLKPDWVDAVRARWMGAQPIDLNQLDADFRLPVFAGLKICITGFDDLDVRAELQQRVIENGGDYTGDLTKDVTHLIAARPEGKKYEYASQWQKKVVALEWFQESLQRGMQLDEAPYDPTKPKEARGVGAWNRRRPGTSPTGRRTRDTDNMPSADTARKCRLRRTASARLNSQNSSVWTDLAGPDDQPVDPDTSSIIDLVPAQGSALPNSNTQNSKPNGQRQPQDHGAFSGHHFLIEGFISNRASILTKTITARGGVICGNIHDFQNYQSPQKHSGIVVLPYPTPLERISGASFMVDTTEIASELWVERCLESNTFIPPSQYHLGRFLLRDKPPGFSKLVVTSTGFTGIMPRHVSKMVNLLGGIYEQTFTPKTSVLICNSRQQNAQKLQVAKSWGVTIVSEKWLWACLQENRKISFDAYGLNMAAASRLRVDPHGGETTISQRPTTHVTEAVNQTATKDTADGMRPTSHSEVINGGNVARSGSDFVLHDDNHSTIAQFDGPTGERTVKSKPTAKLDPLQPISHNSPPKREQLMEKKKKKKLFQTMHATFTDTENSLGSNSMENPTMGTAAAIPAAIPDVQALNGEIRDFLEMKNRSRDQAGLDGTSEKPKKKLIGRALSNLSNSSSTSHIRQSRASSVDSMNTDGIGSDIAPVASLGSKTNEKGEAISKGKFTGRASSSLHKSNSVDTGAITAAIFGQDDEPITAEDETPAMTQLLYEDPVESIQLREKLAAQRRQRSRTGGVDGESASRAPSETAHKRIVDEDIFQDAGWGAGRRTRQKQRSPQGLNAF